MIEIRFHGRGGQGAVVASKLLATAAFLEGRFCQSFPAFGVERRGAPVTAFIRIDDKHIRIRNEVYEPDHVVILDPSLIGQVPLATGLKPDGTVLINTHKKPEEIKGFEGFKVVTVDAGAVALKHGLGTATQPIVNTAILGAFAKMGIVKLESMVEAILQGVPVKEENNAAAARDAYEATIIG